MWLLFFSFIPGLLCEVSTIPNLKLSTENVLFPLPFKCYPYPEDPSSLTEPYYSLCLKFSPLATGFFRPTYIPVIPKGTPPNSPLNCSTQFNTIFPELNFTLSFVIPQSVSALTLAGLFPMTDIKTGEPFENGIQLAEAMRCAVKNINSDQDILPHTRLNFQVWDTHGRASSAINSAYLAMQANVTAFVGLTTYEEVFSVAPLINPSLLSITSGVASSTFLVDKVLFPTFYRTVPGDKFAALSMINLFYSLGWNQFAVVYGNDFVGSSGLDAINSALEETSKYGYNPYLLCEATLSPTEISSTSDDVEVFIECMKTTKVRAIILCANPFDAASVITKIVNAGPSVFTDETIFFAPFSWGGSETSIKTLSELSNGTITPEIMYGSYSLEPRAFSQATVKECLAEQSPMSNFDIGFLRYWQKNFQCTLKGSPIFSIEKYFDSLSESDLTSLYSIFSSKSDISLKYSTNSSAIKNISSLLANVSNDFGPNLAPYTFLLNKIYMFTSVEDPKTKNLSVCQDVDNRDPINALCSCPTTDILVSNKELNPYVNYIYDATYVVALAYNQLIAPCGTSYPCDLPYFTNSELLAAFNDTYFEGLTGTVSWIGHERNSSDISFYQFCENGNKYLVGLSNFSGVYLFKDELCFRTPFIPMSVVIPEVANFSSTIGIIMSLLFVVWILICIFLILFFYLKKDTEPVVSAGLGFLMFLLFGSILISLSAILWTLDSTSFLCIVKIIVLIVGFSMMFGAISGKLFRSFEVYCSLKEYRQGLDPCALLIFSGMTLAVNIFFLAIIFLVSGTPVPSLNRESPSSLFFYIACQCTRDPNLQKIISIVQLAVNLTFILAALIISISITLQPSPHSENTSIVAALLDLFIVSLTLVIIYFNTETITGTIQSQYIIRSVGTIYLLVFTLSILIIPKLLAIARGKPAGDSGEYGGLTPSIGPGETDNQFSLDSSTMPDTFLASLSSSNIVRNRRNRDRGSNVEFITRNC